MLNDAQKFADAVEHAIVIVDMQEAYWNGAPEIARTRHVPTLIKRIAGLVQVAMDEKLGIHVINWRGQGPLIEPIKGILRPYSHVRQHYKTTPWIRYQKDALLENLADYTRIPLLGSGVQFHACVEAVMEDLFCIGFPSVVSAHHTLYTHDTAKSTGNTLYPYPVPLVSAKIGTKEGTHPKKYGEVIPERTKNPVDHRIEWNIIADPRDLAEHTLRAWKKYLTQTQDRKTPSFRPQSAYDTAAQ